MRDKIETILIINGAEERAHSRGAYNRSMVATATETLAPYFNILTTSVVAGYDVKEEIQKFKQADAVIYQYPIYWFMVPASLKKYMDDVFSYGDFYEYTDGPYGSGGLMHGKKLMLSTTWNAPKAAFNNKDTFFGGMSPDEAIFPMRKAHAYCGFEELPHFSVQNVVKDPQFENHSARFSQHLKSVFQITAAIKAA